MNQDQHIVQWDFVRNFHKDLHNTKSIRELIVRKQKHVILHTENVKPTKSYLHHTLLLMWKLSFHIREYIELVPLIAPV